MTGVQTCALPISKMSEKPVDISREIEESVPKPEVVVTKDVAEREEEIAKDVADIPIARDELEERKGTKLVELIKKAVGK